MWEYLLRLSLPKVGHLSVDMYTAMKKWDWALLVVVVVAVDSFAVTFFSEQYNSSTDVEKNELYQDMCTVQVFKLDQAISA